MKSKTQKACPQFDHIKELDYKIIRIAMEIANQFKRNDMCRPITYWSARYERCTSAEVKQFKMSGRYIFKNDILAIHDKLKKAVMNAISLAKPSS